MRRALTSDPDRGSFAYSGSGEDAVYERHEEENEARGLFKASGCFTTSKTCLANTRFNRITHTINNSRT